MKNIITNLLIFLSLLFSVQTAVALPDGWYLHGVDSWDYPDETKYKFSNESGNIYIYTLSLDRLDAGTEFKMTPWSDNSPQWNRAVSNGNNITVGQTMSSWLSATSNSVSESNFSTGATAYKNVTIKIDVTDDNNYKFWFKGTVDNTPVKPAEQYSDWYLEGEKFGWENFSSNDYRLKKEAGSYCYIDLDSPSGEFKVVKYSDSKADWENAFANNSNDAEVKVGEVYCALKNTDSQKNANKVGNDYRLKFPEGLGKVRLLVNYADYSIQLIDIPELSADGVILYTGENDAKATYMTYSSLGFYYVDLTDIESEGKFRIQDGAVYYGGGEGEDEEYDGNGSFVAGQHYNTVADGGYSSFAVGADYARVFYYPADHHVFVVNWNKNDDAAKYGYKDWCFYNWYLVGNQFGWEYRDETSKESDWMQRPNGSLLTRDAHNPYKLNIKVDKATVEAFKGLKLFALRYDQDNKDYLAGWNYAFCRPVGGDALVNNTWYQCSPKSHGGDYGDDEFNGLPYRPSDNYLTEDLAEVEITADVLRYMMLVKGKSLLSLDVPASDLVVFFAGEDGPNVYNVDMIFTDASNNETTCRASVWAVPGREYFYYVSKSDLPEGVFDAAKHVRFKITGRSYQGGVQTVKYVDTESPADGYPYQYAGDSQRFSYIYGPAELARKNGSDYNVSYLSAITPADFLKEATAPLTTLRLVCNKSLKSDLEYDWNINRPEKITLTAGVGVNRFESLAEVDGVRPAFKMSWLDYQKYNEAAGLEYDRTQNIENNPDQVPLLQNRRAYATFNLGAMGGYDTNRATLKANQIALSNFKLRVPKEYNYYSASRWSLHKDENIDTDKPYWLIVDTDPEYQSVTLVTFDPAITGLEVALETPRTVFVYTDDATEGKDTGRVIYEGSADNFNANIDGAQHSRMQQANAVGAEVAFKGVYTSIEADNKAQFEAAFENPTYKFYASTDMDGVTVGGEATNDAVTITTHPLADSIMVSQYTAKIKKVRLPYVPVGYKAWLAVQAQVDYKAYVANNTEHIAKGFRTPPAAKFLAGPTSFKVENPLLGEKPQFNHVYRMDESAYYNENANKNMGDWGLHFQTELRPANSTGLMYYPDYTLGVNDDADSKALATPWEKDYIGKEQSGTYGYIGYEACADESAFDVDKHNWSDFIRQYGLLNVYVDNAIKDDVVSKITVDARLHYPFVINPGVEPQVLESPEQAAAMYVPAVATNVVPWKENGRLLLVTTHARKVYSISNGMIITGVEDVAAAGNREAEYFNLQGVKMQAPVAPGIYIVRRGEKVTKEFVK